MLFAAIHVPDFPVQAALRAEASNGKDPAVNVSLLKTSFKKDQVAILDGPANQMKVMACNEPSRHAGIATGMTKIQAEALPSVLLRKRILDDEFVTQAALLECAGKFSPRLESTCPGSVIIDITGTERLQRGSHKKIAAKLCAAAEECGLDVNVALASNADTAMLAARGMQGITVIAAGMEAESLGPLPVVLVQGFHSKSPEFSGIESSGISSAKLHLQAARLQHGRSQSPGSATAKLQPKDDEIMDALTGWGIRDFKSLAALPEVPLTQRLGQYGLHLQRLAKGEVQRELVPYEEAISFQAGMELEESIELLEPLGLVLNRLLDQLLLQLINRSLAADRIQVDLDLEIHSDCQLQLARQQSGVLEPTYQRVLKLPVPTQDAKIILKLLELDLAGRPPHASVKKVSVEAFPARVKFGQIGLFQPVAPEPAKLEVTLARLRSVVGEKDEQGRPLVGFPVILDSNRPDSFDVQTSMRAAKTKKPRPAESKSIVPRHAMRVLRPPAEVKVGLIRDGLIKTGLVKAGRRGHVPASVSFGDIHSKVVQVSGPWRTNGSWWDQHQAWNREEWDVELCWHEGQKEAGHAIFRIFRDLGSDRWFVEGIYA